MKIDRLTAQERRVVRAALRALVPACSRRVEGACAEALLMARIEEEARDLRGVRTRREESERLDLVGDRRGVRDHDAVCAVAIQPSASQDSDALASVLLDSGVPRG